MRGAFITLEGTEGVGKSTCMRQIENLLMAEGHRVIVTREPGGTPLGERIRDWVLSSEPGSLSAETEALLMFAARAHHLAQVIRPALDNGDWVLCDRFTDATLAYQGAGRGARDDFLGQLTAAVQNDLQPDLTLLLDAPLSVAFGRIDDRAHDHFEQESREFFERVRSGYLSIAASEPERVRIVDASQALETVESSIAAEIADFLVRFEHPHD